LIVKNLAVATMTTMTTIHATTYALSPVEVAPITTAGNTIHNPRFKRMKPPILNRHPRGGALGSVPMLGQRPAVLEDNPDADPDECGEGSDANEGKQEKLPAPGAQEFH
jgi:hypothetical protein